MGDYLPTYLPLNSAVKEPRYRTPETFFEAYEGRTKLVDGVKPVVSSPLGLADIRPRGHKAQDAFLRFGERVGNTNACSRIPSHWTICCRGLPFLLRFIFVLKEQGSIRGKQKCELTKA